VLLGDIGGTNIRLILKRLDLTNRTSSIIKDFTVLQSQKTKNMEEAILGFLAEFKD